MLTLLAGCNEWYEGYNSGIIKLFGHKIILRAKAMGEMQMLKYLEQTLQWKVCFLFLCLIPCQLKGVRFITLQSNSFLLKLATCSNNYLCTGLPWARPNSLNGFDNVHSLDHITKYDVFVVQAGQGLLPRAYLSSGLVCEKGRKIASKINDYNLFSPTYRERIENDSYSVRHWPSINIQDRCAWAWNSHLRTLHPYYKWTFHLSRLPLWCPRPGTWN